MITRSNAWVLTALPESAAVSPPLKVCLQLPPQVAQHSSPYGNQTNTGSLTNKGRMHWADGRGCSVSPPPPCPPVLCKPGGMTAGWVCNQKAGAAAKPALPQSKASENQLGARGGGGGEINQGPKLQLALRGDEHQPRGAQRQKCRFQPPKFQA